MSEITNHTNHISMYEGRLGYAIQDLFWFCPTYCESVGHISKDVIARYIEEQKYH